MSLKSDIIKTIKENRPNLSESSIMTYTTVLINIPSKLNADIKNIKLKWYDNVDNILKYYKDTEPRIRKTKLSALFALTKNQKYQELMKKDIIFVNDNNRNQDKTKKQKENWIEPDEIKKIYEEYYLKANRIPIF